MRCPVQTACLLIVRSPKITNKPVIVTAANTRYYGSLQATLFHVHKHLPDHKIIVYDLGLDANMIATVELFVFIDS